MKKNVTILFILSLIAGNGCLTKRMSNTMNSWMGSHYSELLPQWGPPSHVFDDGQGGRVLVWVYERDYSIEPTSTEPTRVDISLYRVGDQIFGQARVYPPFRYNSIDLRWRAYRMFWIDKEGIVYKWAWRGL